MPSKPRYKKRDEIYRNMSAICSSGSKIEKLLGRSLWALGLRYRKNYRSAEGKPDFAFPGTKVAVFCDSSFWHGRNWGPERKNEFKVNKDFWIKKIGRNIERDKEVNVALENLGWKVLRFWDDEIKNDTERCARKVYDLVSKRRKSLSRPKLQA